MSGWIECGDRMPDKDTEVLTCDSAGNIFLCSYRKVIDVISYKSYYAFTGNYGDLTNITHWMTLPELPDGKQ